MKKENTYLAGEIPWSWRWLSQGEAHPLHSGCADPCDFSKYGKLDCVICGGGGLCSCSPLVEKKKKNLKKYINKSNPFFKGFYLFIFRQRGREGEREREKYQCVVASWYWGPGPQPRHVPWLGIEPATLWSSARAQPTELQQPGLKSIFMG